MWECKHCSEEVEDTFDICWNCNFDKTGSISTFEEIKNNVKEINRQINNSDKINFSGYTMIDPHKIILAGKDIKRAVSFIVLINLFCITGALIISKSRDNELIKNVYILVGSLSFIFNIIVLYKLYSAGENLESSVNNK